MSQYEEKYHEHIAFLEENISYLKEKAHTIQDLSETLMPLFDSIIGIIKESKLALGDDIDEYTETLCLETCFGILDRVRLGYLLYDLLLVARYIAGEAAVLYSTSGVTDVLDTEHRTTRIAAAFLSGLAYLLMQNKKG